MAKHRDGFRPSHSDPYRPRWDRRFIACRIAALACVAAWLAAPASAANLQEPLFLSPAVSVSAGEGHSCARLADGTAWCWGRGDYGQLGNGDMQHRLGPVQVLRDDTGQPLRGVTAIAAGLNFSCAALEDGSAWCWGVGGFGQLGHGDFGPSSRAVRVLRDADGEPLADVTDVATGGFHACATLQDGGVWCWGSGTDGRLGNVDTGNVDTAHRAGAVQVAARDGAPLADAIGVTAGGAHSCAVLSDETAWCWGHADLLGHNRPAGGNDAAAVQAGAVQVLRGDGEPLTGVVGISASTVSHGFGLSDSAHVGGHTCARLADGTAWCWGPGRDGQLGNGGLESRPLAVQVVGDAGLPLFGIVEIAAGHSHSCAALQDGTVRCWGTGFNGQLGNDGVLREQTAPVQVVRVQDDHVFSDERTERQPLTQARTISASGSHSCAVREDGDVWCWGFGMSLGGILPTTGSGFVSWAVPVLAPDHPRFAPDLDDGPRRGDYTGGPMAIGTGVGAHLAPVAGIAAGEGFSCAALADGTAWCWGRNDYGQLGNGDTSAQFFPVQVLQDRGEPLLDVVAIATGGFHACALLADTRVHCWGRADVGQLGRGTADAGAQAFPAAVLDRDGEPLDNVVSVAAGELHTCAALADGTAWCWGASGSNRLGTGVNSSQPQPVPVQVMHAADRPLTGVVDIGAGSSHSCAVLEDRSIWCWSSGTNTLGSGKDAGSVAARMVQVVRGEEQPLIGALTVEVGRNHACAVLDDGSAWCWGSNFNGQLGYGDAEGSHAGAFGGAPYFAVQVVREAGRPLTDVAAVAAGSGHSCAILHDGSTWCWGSDSSGQIGDGGLLPDGSHRGSVGSSDQPFAVQVLQHADGEPLTAAASLSAGYDHTCAVQNDGSAWCWGSGYLGNEGTQGYQPRAALVLTRPGSGDGEAAESLAQVAAIGAGQGHSCAVRDDGSVWCWGSGNLGQLGHGASGDRDLPTRVVRDADGQALTGAVSVAVGLNHSCAVLGDGTAWCWGVGGLGALGNGASSNRAAAVQVLVGDDQALTDVILLDVGGSHSCAVRSTGGVWCWGMGFEGQLGQSAPAGDAALPGADEFEAALRNLENLGLDDLLGDLDVDELLGNMQGLTGAGTPQSSPFAVRVSRNADGQPSAAAVDFAAGQAHSCAALADGTAWCWGAGGAGQLGHGARNDQPLPVQVTRDEDGQPLTGVAAIEAGGNFSCAVLDEGTAWCWGAAPGGTSPYARPVASDDGEVLTDVAAVSAGDQHACAALADGTVWCWGRGGSGRLGHGGTDSPRAQVQVVREAGQVLSGISAIAAGGSHSCAVAEDGAAWCWGSNQEGQLGRGTDGRRISQYLQAVPVLAAEP